MAKMFTGDVRVPELRVLWTCSCCELEIERKTIKMVDGYPCEPRGWEWVAGALYCANCKIEKKAGLSEKALAAGGKRIRSSLW